MGGAIGAVLRYLIGLLPLNPQNGFPLKTFCINVIGAFAIGLVAALSARASFNPRIGAPAGYTTIIVVICFMFAVLFLILGIMGQYIGVLFEEVKGRPIYIVAAERGQKREAESKQMINSQ